MEVANLLNIAVDIEKERRDLSTQGFSWNAIEQQLNEKYRFHSRKGVIHCLCCSQPVELVLSAERVCFFRHKDKEACSGSDNYNRYRKSRDSFEQVQKLQLGRTILKTYFEGQLKIHGIDVQFGYIFREQLSAVPDLLLTFPDQSIWAIDYLTGTRSNPKYQQSILNRLESYQAAGFRAFFLIDQSWYSEHPEQPAASMYPAEAVAMRKTIHDESWKAILEYAVEYFGAESLMPSLNPALLQLEVYSLVYVDFENLSAQLLRIVPIHMPKTTHLPSWSFLLHRPIQISLEELATLNSAKTDFHWYQEEESQLQEMFLEKCRTQYEVLREEQVFKDFLQECRISFEIMKGQFQKTTSHFQKPAIQYVPIHSKNIPVRRSDPFGLSDSTEMVDPDRVESYRDLLERCWASEHLGELPQFQKHIDDCLELFAKYDELGYMDRNTFSILYSKIENLKHALLKE
jgi:hypothetical protein